MARLARLAVTVTLVLTAGSVVVTGPPAAAAPAVTEECGTPLGVSTDADGDVRHRFAMPNGLIEEQVVPSAGFDPTTASGERLSKLGLPARPIGDRAKQTEWDTAALAIKNRATPVPSCARNGVQATFYTDNWAGYRALAASGKRYSGASSSYTAPNYFLSTCSLESMTQWVGVRGEFNGSRRLIQAGVYADQWAGTVEAGGFYEVVGGPWDTGKLISVRNQVPYIAGHRYFFSVQYSDRYKWAVTVSDLDNGNSYSGFVLDTNGGGSEYIQPQAVFVSERLTIDGAYTEYMDHSDVRFRNATVTIYGEGEARMSIQRPEEIVMTSPALGELRLANVDSLNTSTSSFTEHWARCGVRE